MVGHRRKLRSPSKKRNPRGWQLAQRGINRPTPVSVHPYPRITVSPHLSSAVSRHPVRIHFHGQKVELKNKLPKTLRSAFSPSSIASVRLIAPFLTSPFLLYSLCNRIQEIRDCSSNSSLIFFSLFFLNKSYDTFKICHIHAHLSWISYSHSTS